MVDNLYVDSAGLPPKLAFSVCQHLLEYVRLVIEKEWPPQQAVPQTNLSVASLDRKEG